MTNAKSLWEWRRHTMGSGSLELRRQGGGWWFGATVVYFLGNLSQEKFGENGCLLRSTLGIPPQVVGPEHQERKARSTRQLQGRISLCILWPVIAHLDGLEEIQTWDWSKYFSLVPGALWALPLSIILPRSENYRFHFYLWACATVLTPIFQLSELPDTQFHTGWLTGVWGRSPPGLKSGTQLLWSRDTMFS